MVFLLQFCSKFLLQLYMQICDTSLKMSDSILSTRSIPAPVNNGYLEDHTDTCPCSVSCTLTSKT